MATNLVRRLVTAVVPNTAFPDELFVHSHSASSSSFFGTATYDILGVTCGYQFQKAEPS